MCSLSLQDWTGDSVIGGNRAIASARRLFVVALAGGSAAESAVVSEKVFDLQDPKFRIKSEKVFRCCPNHSDPSASVPDRSPARFTSPTRVADRAIRRRSERERKPRCLRARANVPLAVGVGPFFGCSIRIGIKKIKIRIGCKFVAEP